MVLYFNDYVIGEVGLFHVSLYKCKFAQAFHDIKGRSNDWFT